MRYHGGYEKCAHLYDLFDKKENIEFFYHYASEVKETLDIGAGTGRIAIPLAERGEVKIESSVMEIIVWQEHSALSCFYL